MFPGEPLLNPSPSQLRNGAPLLLARGLSKAFPGVQALSDVRLEVAAGSIHALMGENGAGKSTLLRILAGLEQPSSGELFLDGLPLRLRRPADALRQGISMIHQELLPFPELTVAENIFMGREPRGRLPGFLDRRAMEAAALPLLQRLGAAFSPRDRLRDLPVASVQLVEIAKALAHRARLLILDEPTSALSTREIDSLFAILRSLQREGAAILYVSHKFDEVFALADRITVLRDGCAVASGPAADLSPESLIRLMVGRDLPPRNARPSAPPGPVILETRNLSRPGAFQGVSLRLHRGEVLGLAGLLGAGRSSLLRALAGLAPASAGEILHRGHPVSLRHPRQALRLGIALAPEDRKLEGLVLTLGARQNLTLSSLASFCRGPLLQHREEIRAADAQIRALAIRTAGRDAPVRGLSGGNQQKVVLGKALLARPEILLLDEPTRGIDIAAKAEIHELIRRLAADGLSVILASSELPELFSLSDRILVMRQGTVSAGLDPRTASQEEILRHAMQPPSASPA